MSILTTTNRASNRKLYPNGRSAPVIQTLSNGETVDINRFQIHRDMFVITTRVAGKPELSYPLGVYEDDYVSFSNQTSKTIFFSQSFPDVPIVVVTLEDNSGFENVVAYLSALSSTQVTIGLSANYSGNVRYRAVYATEYPALVYDQPNNPSVSLLCTATKVDLVAANSFTVNFASLGTIPANSFYTVLDLQNNQDVDVFISSGSVDATTGTGDLSAPITNRIHFIGLDSI